MTLEGYVLKKDEFDFLKNLIMLMNDQQRHLLINSICDKETEFDEEVVKAYGHYVRHTNSYLRRNSDGKLVVLDKPVIKDNDDDSE